MRQASNVYNFAEAKDLTFNRVLIMPTKAITDFLDKGILNMACESKAKFYVALTRAKYSVTFVLKKHIQTKFFKEKTASVQWSLGLRPLK
ncbi:hypothetical protein ABD86_21540 [Paenibacillus alvei]|nr:hypothetical protein [Paenibacillus alvei]MBG9746409.1 hypothetical protein [Paenibacillus alvei]